MARVGMHWEISTGLYDDIEHLQNKISLLWFKIKR